MNVGYLALGILLLIVTIVDQIWTALWVDGGAGPFSSRLTTGMWRGLKRLGGPRSRLLSLSGPLILMLTLVLWVGLLWAGWTFVFAGGGQDALTYTRGPRSVTWTGRIYFVAYTMFTMGNGDFTPTVGIWQVATGLTTASGMLFVTMSVSYILSVLGAVVDKRSFATGVSGVGNQSEVFVKTGWNEETEDFHELDLKLDSFSSQLDTLTEQHRAYPILHYYHSRQAKHASPVSAAILDEALLILRCGVPEGHGPNETLVKSARSSTRGYLQTLNKAFISPADETPPPPNLARLREDGVPTVSDEEFAEDLNESKERRRKLLGMVRNDAWEWRLTNDD